MARPVADRADACPIRSPLDLYPARYGRRRARRHGTPGSGRDTFAAARHAPHLRQRLGQSQQRLRHAALEQRCRRSADTARGEGPSRIGRRDGGMHQHAGIAVAGHHAVVARLALVGDALQIENRTERLVPGLAAPDVEVPVEIEIFIAANARNRLPLAAHIARDFGERGGLSTGNCFRSRRIASSAASNSSRPRSTSDEFAL